MNDSLFWVLLLLRYMHILGAIALMGGTIFMRFALAPTVAGLDEKSRQQLHDGVRGRWAKFVMIAAALLLVSGLANMVLIPMNYELGGVVNNKQYNMIVGIKFILALPIFLFASFLTGRSATARKFQANATLWMNVNLALAIVMVLIGGYLKFAERLPKSKPVGQVSNLSCPVSTWTGENLSYFSGNSSSAACLAYSGIWR